MAGSKWPGKSSRGLLLLCNNRAEAVQGFFNEEYYKRKKKKLTRRTCARAAQGRLVLAPEPWMYVEGKTSRTARRKSATRESNLLKGHNSRAQPRAMAQVVTTPLLITKSPNLDPAVNEQPQGKASTPGIGSCTLDDRNGETQCAVLGKQEKRVVRPNSGSNC